MEEKDTTDEQKKFDEEKEYCISQRIDTAMYLAFLAGFIYFCFNEGLFDTSLLNGIGEICREFLPPFYAHVTTIMICFGIGFLILHRALKGQSWFNKFHANEYYRYHKPLRGVLYGLFLYTILCMMLLLIIWIMLEFSQKIEFSFWILLPLQLIAIGITVAISWFLLDLVSKWLDVPDATKYGGK